MIWWRWCWSCDDSSLLADVIWCTFGSLASGNGAARNQHEADYWYEKAWVISMIARPFAFPHGSVCGTITINGFDGIKLLVAAHSLSFRIFPAQAAVHGYRRPKNSFRSWWGFFSFLGKTVKGRRRFVPSSQYDMVWLYRVRSIAYEVSLALPFLYRCTSLYHLFSYYAVPVYLQTHLQDCRSTTDCLKQLAMLIGGPVCGFFFRARTQAYSGSLFSSFSSTSGKEL